MTSPKTTTKGPAKAGLKMKDLVKATGVTKSTLLYYVSLGLIPGPVKTRPNVAYYDPACIERVRFIHAMKRRHRLSLSEIRPIMERWGDAEAFSAYNELSDFVFGPSRKEGLLDRQAFLAATGLTEEQADELLGARLLLPLETGRFDQEDAAMGRVLARGLSWGLRIEDLSFYVETSERIVDCEMRLRNELTRDRPVHEDAAMTLEMVQSARTSRAYVTERLFQHRVAAMRGLKEEGPDSEHGRTSSFIQEEDP